MPTPMVETSSAGRSSGGGSKTSVTTSANLAMARGYAEAYQSVRTQSIAASTSDTRAVATEIRVSDMP
jgi:hypothetical protein